MCKLCQKRRFKIYYDANKGKYKKSAYEHKKKVGLENRLKLAEYLVKHPCVDCHNNNIVVLDFDHVRGTKRYNVSAMLRTGHSWKGILKEIDKCDVRCANCHRIKTAKDFNYWRLTVTL